VLGYWNNFSIARHSNAIIAGRGVRTGRRRIQET
jgi:hypothetical protein